MIYALNDRQWEYFVSLISRIYNAEEFDAVFDILSSHLSTLIPFDSSICLRTERVNGEPVIVSFNQKSTVAGFDDRAFLNGGYRLWGEFILSSKTTVFRQSDFVSEEKWEKTRTYMQVWKPRNIYYGLFISVIKDDVPLAIYGFFRSKKSKDFSQQDVNLISLLREALENSLYKLLYKNKEVPSEAEEAIGIMKKYNLTKREFEITQLICENLNNDEICKKLFISSSTLNKHLSNIYKKVGVRSIGQLYVQLTANKSN